MTEAVFARIATADVRADPQQVGEHGHWTTRADVLRAAPIFDGEMITATWGACTWQGRAHWDRDDPNLLWLRPEPIAAIPAVWAHYPVSALLDDVLADLTTMGLLPDHHSSRFLAETIIRTHLELVFEDVESALAFAVRSAVRRADTRIPGLQARRPDVARHGS